VDLLPDVDEDALLDDVVMLPWAAMEKELVVERTSVMLLIATASTVYPSPGATIGNSRVILRAEVATLLPIAKESWKAVFKSSRTKKAGSPASVVHLKVP